MDVLVVDDSQFMRTVISDILSDAGMNVVATESNGKDAVDSVATHNPDVITMDLKMPEMDGIEATKEIMQSNPTPILIISAHAEEGADMTFEALENGAVDFFTKPSGEVSVGIKQQAESLVSNIRDVASASVTSASQKTITPEYGSISLTGNYNDKTTLIIGASTGGPSVVEDVISNIDIDANLRILIIQHMPHDFTKRFANRIDEKTEYDVMEAEDGMRIGGGDAVVAKGGKHMLVEGYGGGRIRLGLSDDEKVNSVRPAIDVTMETASNTILGPMVGVILTGMGQDGAEGVKHMKDAGANIIVQDEKTSTVHAMPSAAIDTGCVDRVLPQNEIVEGILDYVNED